MTHANLPPPLATPKDKSARMGEPVGRADEPFVAGRSHSSPPLASACQAVAKAAHLFTASGESARSLALLRHALRRCLLRRALRFLLIPLRGSSLLSSLM